MGLWELPWGSGAVTMQLCTKQTQTSRGERESRLDIQKLGSQDCEADKAKRERTTRGGAERKILNRGG